MAPRPLTRSAGGRLAAAAFGCPCRSGAGCATPEPFSSSKLSALGESALSNHLKCVGGITPHKVPVSLPDDEASPDESLSQRRLQWELVCAGSRPKVLHWCYRELNSNLQDPQLGLSCKTILQPFFAFCTLLNRSMSEGI